MTFLVRERLSLGQESHVVETRIEAENAEKAREINERGSELAQRIATMMIPTAALVTREVISVEPAEDEVDHILDADAIDAPDFLR